MKPFGAVRASTLLPDECPAGARWTVPIVPWPLKKERVLELKETDPPACSIS